jgi:hypothetical protein
VKAGKFPERRKSGTGLGSPELARERKAGISGYKQAVSRIEETLVGKLFGLAIPHDIF